MSARTCSLFALLTLFFLVSGCATSSSGVVYNSRQTRTPQKVESGIVVSVTPVTIQDDGTGQGVVLGGVAGGFAGSTIGSGSGSTLGAVAGALGGAALGHLAEKQLKNKNGLEIRVHKPDGTIISVVQEADVMFYAGDRVDILTAPKGTTRIVKKP